ncbi:hypothetical protein M407DRAFT_128753 [Tulasnella calospora MUT 4182]|uniref:Uncharacterized protein n=1 Tax=Tulasnella calospora MUT 4182 TaxID=1051891 RepID=A0A0C3QTM5_9AGAM|nr:hypothetical protein M407DRAFT_128753 [Tulasnella calospora MUT 4182]
MLTRAGFSPLASRFQTSSATSAKNVVQRQQEARPSRSVQRCRSNPRQVQQPDVRSTPML